MEKSAYLRANVMSEFPDSVLPVQSVEQTDLFQVSYFRPRGTSLKQTVARHASYV